MPFRVSERTLERLEWPEVVARLLALCATPQCAARCREAQDGGAALFHGEAEAVREALARTSEARGLVDGGEIPPLGGVSDLGAALAHAAKGGSLAPVDLLAVAATLAALRATRRFLVARGERAPRLAALAERIVECPELESALAAALDPEGELRDDASPALAAARSDARHLAGEVQRRITAELRRADVAEALSDAFFTLRSGRYVLPVRADSRSRVPGIVHDASASGTTLFVEPEAVVEVNNRLKQAELAGEREAQRVLRELSARAGARGEDIAAGLAALAEIDLSFARGRLSREWDGVPPEVGDEGVFVLPQLRHPLLARERVVPNDVRLGRDFRVLVLSGPNAGGKTVAMKALALAALCVRAGLHVPASPGARADLVDAVLAEIGDEQSLRESLSTFSAHVAHLAEIVRHADARTLIALDEVGVGTDPAEGAALAQAVLEALADSGARVMATTHYNLLKECAAVDPRFENASVDFDAVTLAPTYRLRIGPAGASSAVAVAARMGMPGAVLERANALLEREDRQLDRLLSELSATRASLEREREAAEQVRTEGEAARTRYRQKLEALQARRDALFAEMRADLDRAFGDAHAQVAAVIRTLQRGGSARDAAHARERLLDLEVRAKAAGEASRKRVPEEAPVSPPDWSEVAPGAAVRVAGGRTGVLLTLPDRRGRVAVQVSGARLSVPADRVALAEAAAPAPRRPAPRVVVEGARDAGEGDASGRCDLRGLHVDEALDRASAELDRAAARGAARLLLVHGIGTGALREAVRAYLRESPYVLRFESAASDEGGEGATWAILAD
jgi:DNA mismatch repair protein MutS2